MPHWISEFRSRLYSHNDQKPQTILTRNLLSSSKKSRFSFTLNWEYLLLFLLTLSACILRLYFIFHDWPTSNSDEATMGLMALHIAQGRDYPIFFYGQSYMGTIQAYLGSVFFSFLGPSLYALRLGLVIIFIFTFISLYFLIKTIYDRSFAFLCLVLLILGSSTIITAQLFANGGYAETLCFSISIFLLTSQIILSSYPEQRYPTNWRRFLHWGTLGLIFGLAIYSDILILPTALTTSLLLFFFARRELFSRMGLLFLAGILLALLPTILYNLSVPFSHSTFMAYAGSSGYAAIAKTKNHISLPQQFLQALLITLPDATGMSPTCPIPEPVHASSVFFQIFPPQQQSCAIFSILWTIGYMTLAVLAATHAVKQLFQLYLYHKTRAIPANKYAPEYLRGWIRLMLLVSAILTFLLYTVSAPAALNPQSTARYLSDMLIAVPALIWPFWQWALANKYAPWYKHMTPYVLLLSIFLLFFKGSMDIGTRIPANETTIQHQTTLINFLSHHHMTRFYTDYWTCNNLIFQSREHLLCATLDEHLQPALDRYPPYAAAVHAQPYHTYVFQQHTPQTTLLDTKIQQRPDLHITRTVVENYVIYQSTTLSSSHTLDFS